MGNSLPAPTTEHRAQMQINMCSRQSFNSFARQSIKRCTLVAGMGSRGSGPSNSLKWHKQASQWKRFSPFFLFFFLPNRRRRHCNLIFHLSGTSPEQAPQQIWNSYAMPSNRMFTQRVGGSAGGGGGPHASSLIRHVV